MSADRYVRIGPCDIDPSAQVCMGAVVGRPYRPLVDVVDTEPEVEIRTHIGAHCYVGYHSVIGAGSTVSDGAVIDDYCIIESSVVIGSKSLLIYRAQVCSEAHVGSSCVIGGFVAERVVVGDRVRLFGKVVHSHRDPTRAWDAPESTEESAILESDAFVGFDALVTGNVVIGSKAYVCAGAIVTRSVPSRHVAYGVNKIVPASAWKGPLHRSPLFDQRPPK